MDISPFHPHSVKEGDMAVATDSAGDHYCVFVKRHPNAWEVLSLEKKLLIMLGDEQFKVLVQARNFRLVQRG